MEKFKVTKGPDNQEQLTKNVVLVEGLNARYRIVYGAHIVEQKPKDIGISDASALETGFDSYSTAEEARKTFDGLKDQIQYKKIIERAEQDKKPIFFVDLNEAEIIEMLQVGIRAAESATSILLLLQLTKIFTDSKKITRREFLGKSIKGIAGLYFLSNLAGDFSDIFELTKGIDEQSASRALHRFLTDLNEKIHPETDAILLTLRNAIMARKLKTIAEELTNEKNKKGKSKKSDIAIVVGAAHVGLEKALQRDDKDLIEQIDKLLSVPTLKKAREEVATIARFDFDEKTWTWNVKLSKDPHLMPLEKK